MARFLMAAVLALPLAGLALGLGGDPQWDRAFDAGRLLRTAMIGLGAAAAAIALGVPSGLALSSTRRVPMALALIPLMIPPGLAAIEWIGLGLPIGPLTTPLVLGATLWPVATLFTWAGLRRIDPAALEAARLHARRPFAQVVWPLIRRAVAESAVVVFILAVADFSVAGTFGVDVQSMAILQRLEGSGTTAAVVAALPYVLVALAATTLKSWPSAGMRTEPVAWMSAPMRAACWAVAIAAWVATALVPTVAVVSSMTHVGAALTHHGEKIGLTLWTSAVVAVMLAAWALMRPPFDRLWALLMALPSVLVAAGVVGWGRDTMVPLMLATAAHYAFVAVLVVKAAVTSAPAAPQEAARLAGRSPWRLVVWPHARPAVIAGAAVLFLLAAGEVAPAVLLSPPGRETVMQRLYNLIHYGYAEAATLAGLCLTATWTVMLALVRR